MAKILVVCFCILVGWTSGFDNTHSLKSISVLFRHGDRTPQLKRFYPTDPHKDNPMEPMGYGGLTKEGKRREHRIGSKLRERYDEFLGDTYRSSDISVTSTHSERTKMSLLLALAGLYPPKAEQVWNGALDWQPIPVNSLPEDMGTFVHAIGCPTYVKELNRVKASKEYKKDLSRFDELMRDLTVFTGRETHDVNTIFHTFHTLMAEREMGLPLPEWTKFYFPSGLMLDATLFEYQTQSYNTVLKRLNGGLLIRKILDDNVDVLGGKKNSTKVHLYSAHEDNVAAALFALGIWINAVPEYGSALVIELHESESKFFVRPVYYKSIPAEFEVKKFPGCAEFCPIEDFLKIFKDVTPADVMETCFGPPDQSLLVPKSTNPIVWIYKKIKEWFHL